MGIRNMIDLKNDCILLLKFIYNLYEGYNRCKMIEY